MGDHATGFESHNKNLKIFKYCNDYFQRRNNVWLEVRSNHCNPRYFDGSINLSNFKLIPDNSIIEIEGKRFVFLGGAISIDRRFRHENSTYWKDEVFVLNEEVLSSICGANYIIAHSNPNFCHPQEKSGIRDYCIRDHDLYDDIEKERNDLAKAYKILAKNNNIKEWINGHYHWSHLEINFGTKFRTLAIEEFYEIR